MNSMIINQSIQEDSPQNKCRICFNEICDEEIVQYCACRGDIGMVHEECLMKWLIIRNIDECEICKEKFNLKKEYNINPRLIYILVILLLWIGLLLLNIFDKFTKFSIFILIFIMLIILTNIMNFYILKNMYLVKSIKLMPFYTERSALVINEV